MKTACVYAISRNRFGLRYVILGVILVVSRTECIGGDPGGDQTLSTSLVEQVSRNEDLWKQGKHVGYYDSSAGLAGKIVAATGETNANQAAAALLDNLLAKEAPIDKTGTGPPADEMATGGLSTDCDLMIMERLVRHLASHQPSSSDDRRRTASSLSQYLGRVRKEIVPNYQPRLVETNVGPPPGTPGPAMGGMDPEAIKDPVYREKYKEARRQNQENAAINSRQTFLQEMNVFDGPQVINYLIEAYNAGALSSANLADCMKSAALTDDEKKEITSRVRSK